MQSRMSAGPSRRTESREPYANRNEGLAEQMEMLERDQTGLYFERHEEDLRVVAQAREQGRLTGIDQF